MRGSIMDCGGPAAVPYRRAQRRGGVAGQGLTALDRQTQRRTTTVPNHVVGCR